MHIKFQSKIMKLVNKEISHIYEAGIDNMIVLVSTRVRGKNYVMTSSTTAEVSHDPPLLSVSISPDRYTHSRISERKAFAINVLSLGQRSLAAACGSCSGRDVDKFDRFEIKFTLSNGQLPFIDGCLANIGCRVVAAYEHGDHTLFVGEMFESRVYGQREQRHLLLSDMKMPAPSWVPRSLYYFVKRFPFIYKLRDLLHP